MSAGLQSHWTWDVLRTSIGCSIYVHLFQTKSERPRDVQLNSIMEVYCQANFQSPEDGPIMSTIGVHYWKVEFQISNWCSWYPHDVAKFPIKDVFEDPRYASVLFSNTQHGFPYWKLIFHQRGNLRNDHHEFWLSFIKKVVYGRLSEAKPVQDANFFPSFI